jgi:hypothetical protein
VPFSSLRKTPRRAIRETPLIGGLLILLLLAAISPAARAQDVAVQDYLQRLPENTLLYISWHDLEGLPELRATNPLLRFIDSPEMKANWESLKEYRERIRARDEAPTPEAGRPGRAPEEFPFRKLARLLENPGVLALVIAPDGNDGGSRPPQLTALYLYDMTGMEELLAELETELTPPGLTRRTYDFEGVAVVETAGDKGPVSYQARIASWIVGGDDQETVEAWIRAVQMAPERSLKDTVAYRRATTVRPDGAQVEVFLNPEVLAQVPQERGEGENQPVGDELKALASPRWFEDWELFLFTATLADDRTRYDAHALHAGEAAELVEVVAPSVSHFPSLDFTPPDASSYAVIELDLSAIWRVLQEALQDLPPQSAQLAGGFQGMVEGLLGIPLDELVGAWGREFAQLSYASGEGEIPHTLRVLELADQQVILTALRALVVAFGPQMNLEELPAGPDEDIVYFRLGSRDGPSTFYAAVADKWLLVGRSREEISQALVRSQQGPTFSDSPLYRSLRGRFPPALSTFSFADAERLLASDWAEDMLRGLARSLVEAEHERDESGQAEPGAPEADDLPPPPTLAEPPELKIPLGYLKWWVSGTYRDEQGLHHSGYIE